MSPRPPVLLSCAALALVLAGAFARSACAQWVENGAKVCGAETDQYVPIIAADGAGGAIIAWTDLRDGAAAYDLYAQRIDSTGATRWAFNGVPVCVGTPNAVQTSVVGDGSGGGYVFWNDYRSGGSLYAQRFNATGTALWTANGIPLCTAGATGYSPRAILDGRFDLVNGPGATVVFGDARTGDNDIFAQHVDPSGTVLWAPVSTGVAIGQAPGSQDTPVLCTDNTGSLTSVKGAFVAWNSYTNSVSQVYVNHLSGSGTPQYGASGIGISPLTSASIEPAIAFTLSGTAIVAWSDERAPGQQIYAQKISTASTGLWTTGGVPVCATSGRHESPGVVSNGNGGAIVAWYDVLDSGPHPSQFDLYAQMLDTNGNALWGAGGMPICTAPNKQTDLAIASDGAGGAFFAWADVRSGAYDIYAQHVNAAGQMLWPANGELVCASPGDQFESVLTAEPSGRAIVAWADGRSGTDNDIYAAPLFPNETLAAPSAGPAPTRFAITATNPARGDARIALDLPRASRVSVDVMDPLGRRVRALVAGERFAAGRHELRWDGRDAAGKAAGSGVYFVRVSTASESRVAKLVELR